MKSNLYIPKTLKIGFQERHDTFTQKLAYVIYYDDKKVLRKETSWNSWRDKKIEPIEIANVATAGFNLNKGVKRDGYWGSGRSVIRVWDPRDFEFEISVDNLIGILMHSDVSKRDIQEQCVFAWYGTELVLLPVNSEEYQSSVVYTNKQANKFSSKSLVPGHTYMPKKEDTAYIYLGRFDHFEGKGSSYDYAEGSYQFQKPKKHWFIRIDGTVAEPKDPNTFISHVVNEDIHTNYPTALENLHKTALVQSITGFQAVPLTLEEFGKRHEFYVELQPRHFVKFSIGSTWSREAPSGRKFVLTTNHALHIEDNGKIQYDGNSHHCYSYITQEYRRQSSFGLTTEHTSVKALEVAIGDIPIECSAEYSNYGNAPVKEQVDKQVYDYIMSKCKEASTLQFVLANGKNTERLSYGY